MDRRIAERFNPLSFHDAILNWARLDFVHSEIEFNVEYITESIEESAGVFKPVYRNATTLLKGIYKLRFNGELDPVNKQIIYDFDLIEDSEEVQSLRHELRTDNIVQFHIYASSNLEMDIFCRDFVFRLEGKKGPGKTGRWKEGLTRQTR